MLKANCQMTPLKALEVNSVAYAFTLFLCKQLELFVIALLERHMSIMDFSLEKVSVF